LAAYDFLVAMSAAGLSGEPSPEAVHEARTANEAQTRNQFRPKRAYELHRHWKRASGSTIAGEFSKTGADVPVVEAGGEDAGPMISAKVTNGG
jgi:hypothetical protein